VATLSVKVFRDARSTDVLTEMEDEATLAVPSLFIPIAHDLWSVTALPGYLDELRNSPVQPSIKEIQVRHREQCNYCCAMCVFFVYALSWTGAQGRCCCCVAREDE
jgi:hypothetical protein